MVDKQAKPDELSDRPFDNEIDWSKKFPACGDTGYSHRTYVYQDWTGWHCFRCWHFWHENEDHGHV